MRNGILLTGGTGSRLLPATQTTNKHLLDVCGRMLIDYPIETLRRMGVENLTVIVGSSHSGQILDYLRDGAAHGLRVAYLYQSEPRGISHAFNLARREVSDDNQFVCLLGDNWFEQPIGPTVKPDRAQIILNAHPELKRFGVATLDGQNRIVRLEEKPRRLSTRHRQLAITGCYVFDHRYFDFFARTTPSARNEYELVDVIRQYHDAGALDHQTVSGRWIDAGTHASLAEVRKAISDGSA